MAIVGPTVICGNWLHSRDWRIRLGFGFAVQYIKDRVQPRINIVVEWSAVKYSQTIEDVIFRLALLQLVHLHFRLYVDHVCLSVTSPQQCFRENG